MWCRASPRLDIVGLLDVDVPGHQRLGVRVYCPGTPSRSRTGLCGKVMIALIQSKFFATPFQSI